MFALIGLDDHIKYMPIETWMKDISVYIPRFKKLYIYFS